MTEDPLITARELEFQLHTLLDVAALCRRPRFAGHGRDTIDAVLETARAIALDRFLPHNREADRAEPRLVDGRVVLVPGVKAALDAYNAAGFTAAAFDAEDGGLQLPWTVAQACQALFYGANIATAAYPMLTVAAANLLRAAGTPTQRERWLRPMLAGRFFGTMCLSEPQAGSSLGDIAMRATPAADGTYRLAGTKMWISGGEHDLAETIVHLVLARIDGAPPGVRGLSLFLVPRDRLDTGGDPSEGNDVTLVGLNHKMGYRGTVNTVLSFGDRGDCRGELVGAPDQGLACMFHMMNEARVAVGLGAAALAYAGYRHALAYARERRQGRAPGDKDPARPAVPIVTHADVRRMLLAQKAIAEGALALGFHCATLVDRCADAEGEEEAESCHLLLELLTPVMKAWSSAHGLEANDLAIQVLGGYGYTRDFPVEQLWRDNRLNPIHEGTNGIQAADLLGRKAGLVGGKALSLLLAEIGRTVEATGAGLSELAGALRRAADTLWAVTNLLLARRRDGSAEAALADATDYLELAGTVVVAWMWLRQANAAAALAQGDRDDPLLLGKIQAARWFFACELPFVEVRARILRAGPTPAFAMRDAWF